MIRIFLKSLCSSVSSVVKGFAFSVSPRLRGRFCLSDHGDRVATGATGKPDFGLAGWDNGDHGDFFLSLCSSVSSVVKVFRFSPRSVVNFCILSDQLNQR